MLFFLWLHRGAERTDLHGRTLDFSLWSFSSIFPHYDRDHVIRAGSADPESFVARKQEVASHRGQLPLYSDFQIYLLYPPLLGNLSHCSRSLFLHLSLSPSPLSPPYCPPSPVSLPSVSLSHMFTHSCPDHLCWWWLSPVQLVAVLCCAVLWLSGTQAVLQCSERFHGEGMQSANN